MSLEDNGSRGGSVKTLAIRLELDRHAQLTMIAQLRGNTITEELQLAVEAHIAAIKAQPQFAAQAEAVLTEIEREAAARRAAIGALFGDDGAVGGGTSGGGDTGRSRSRKAPGDGSAAG